MNASHIVLFSSGISEQNGLLNHVRTALEKKGHHCSVWRDLFQTANDANNIALLPTLIKKIPTFDYAVLICEGHDTTFISRNGFQEEVRTMRDNVLFEIGLCSMALGLSRTVLLADEDVRLPDDLVGTGHELGVKRISFPVHLSQAEEEEQRRFSQEAAEEIHRYITQTKDVVHQVVIGAATSLACGYVSNFICRTLEHIEDDILLGPKESGYPAHFSPEKVHMQILLPESITPETLRKIRQKTDSLTKGCIPSARSRPADFHCIVNGDELHIIDHPTNIVTSYDTAKLILELDADDTQDAEAELRFTAKELHLYEASLRSILNENFIHEVIEQNYAKASREEQLYREQLVTDILTHRLTIKRVTY